MSRKKMTSLPAKVRFKQMVACTLLATDMISFFNNQIYFLESEKRDKVKSFADVWKMRQQYKRLIKARDKWVRIRFKMYSKTSIYAQECEKEELGSSLDYAVGAKFDYSASIRPN